MPNLKEIIYGIKHPKSSILYLLLGRERYWHLMQTNSCMNADDVISPVSRHVTSSTDIHEHLTTLYMLATEFDCTTLVELGTRSGESTLALAYAAKRTGGKLYSFDIADCVEAKKAMADRSLTPYWEFSIGNDLEVNWNRKIDFLFIDTSHTYEHTLKELVRFEPFVKSGGIIAMHDSVACPGVKKAVKEYAENKPNLRIYEYVNNNGLFLIFKKPAS